MFKQGDHNSLKEAILRLKNDNLLREKIAKNGYEFYMKNFSLGVTSEKLAEFCSKLCGGGN